MHRRGHMSGRGAHVAGCVCMTGGMHWGGGGAWQERRPLQHPTGMHSCLCIYSFLDLFSPSLLYFFITVRKRSCRKVMFLHLSVSHSVHKGAGSASVHAGIHTLLGRHPPADGHCSGRYASYWNAFLFIYLLTSLSFYLLISWFIYLFAYWSLNFFIYLCIYLFMYVSECIWTGVIRNWNEYF